MSSLNDKAAQKKLKAREYRLVEQRKSDMRAVLGLVEGRRVVWDLIFDKLGLQDAYLTADSGIYRHEGKREAAMHLARELQEVHPEAYLLMITERLEFIKLDRATRETIERESEENDG